MKSIDAITRLLGLPAIVLLNGLLFSGLGNAAGLMTPANGSLADLEIREHHVNVVIEDGYAITTVNQVFRNPHGLLPGGPSGLRRRRQPVVQGRPFHVVRPADRRV